jgi:hypothetical protein
MAEAETEATMRGWTKAWSRRVALSAVLVVQAGSLAAQPKTATEAATDPDSVSDSDPVSDPDPDPDSDSVSVSDPDSASASVPAPARVEPSEEAYSTRVVYVHNPGSKLGGSLALRTGVLELGAELMLLTSGAELAGASVGFTDVGMLRLRARKSLSDELELFAATQLLAKQPSASDAALWQGALLGGQWFFAADYALALRASVGPVLDAGDGYLAISPGLVTKQRVDHHVHFELGLAYGFTALDLVAPGDALFHVHEAIAHAEVQLGDRSGGIFARFAYHLPFASGPSEARSPGRYLDPSPQLNLQLGAVLVAGANRDWDIYAACAVVDRGELNDAVTSLPILDGGFDQQQWIFGVLHRFGADPTPLR